MKLKNMRRSEDTEQIHVCNWAAWNENRYPELKWLHHIPNGRHQDSQIEFLHDMAKNGHYVATCYTAGDAITVLEEYLQLDNMMEMLEPNDSIWNEGKIKELKHRAPKEVKEWMTENDRA